jgi:succinoglycan biosynthesis protein ExoM
VAARQLQLRIEYIHAPADNIALARNACLDHASAPLLAFIDDDEVADADWLAQLHAGLQSLDVVFGPVRALYVDAAPEWMRRGDFHSKTPARHRDGRCETGHTANVLLRRSCIGTRRFLPSLGRSGGEDTMFFAMLKHDGARLGYCARAEVKEVVTADRAKFGWLCRRAYGSGQAHARMLLFRQHSRARLVPVAASKLAYCVLATLVCIWSGVRWRRQVLRGSLHLGVIATALGVTDVEFYGGNRHATDA